MPLMCTVDAYECRCWKCHRTVELPALLHWPPLVGGAQKGGHKPLPKQEKHHVQDDIQHRSSVRRLIEEVITQLDGDDELRLRTRPACLKLLTATELLRRSERAMNADPLKEWPLRQGIQMPGQARAFRGRHSPLFDAA
jgi:hypothetical protein